MHAPSSERPVPLRRLPAASVTPDRAISGTPAEQRSIGLCRSCFRESESSSFDRERSRRSRGGKHHTRQGDQRCARRAASCRDHRHMQVYSSSSSVPWGEHIRCYCRRRAALLTGQARRIAPGAIPGAAVILVERKVLLVGGAESESANLSGPYARQTRRSR
jgi:hypothetical protein